MKIAVYFASCIAAMLLVGCATPVEMRARAPALNLISSRPAKAVAICIADRWENSSVLGNTIPINMRPTANGYTVSWRHEGWGHTGLLADVDDAAVGSTTRYFKNAVLGEEIFDNAVKECQ